MLNASFRPPSGSSFVEDEFTPLTQRRLTSAETLTAALRPISAVEANFTLFQKRTFRLA
jgi:hypothetical protein